MEVIAGGTRKHGNHLSNSVRGSNNSKLHCSVVGLSLCSSWRCGSVEKRLLGSRYIGSNSVRTASVGFSLPCSLRLLDFSLPVEIVVVTIVVVVVVIVIVPFCVGGDWQMLCLSSVLRKS